ncbi:MAG: hypothetical protein GY705_25280 [Bacteroidetes bacterium]|nr:hypothetical protein [Bacteroidota bacterium]
MLETMVTWESVGDNTNTGGSAVAGVITSNFIPTTFSIKKGINRSSVLQNMDSIVVFAIPLFY